MNARYLRWVECEYCNRDDVVLYSWHADIWCASCIRRHIFILPMTGELEDAPIGRPENVTYEQPYVFQTPKHTVHCGVVL